MAQSIHRFEISLADAERCVYEELSFRLVQHPSETEAYLITRALAHCVLYEDGIHVMPGICQGDEPALELRDATGRRTHWIDVGRPGAAHVQRGLRDSPRVSLVTTRDPHDALRVLREADVRLLDRLEIVGLEPELVRSLAARLDRRNRWTVTLSGGHLYVEADGETLHGALDRLTAQAA